MRFHLTAKAVHISQITSSILIYYHFIFNLSLDAFRIGDHVSCQTTVLVKRGPQTLNPASPPHFTIHLPRTAADLLERQILDGYLFHE